MSHRFAKKVAVITGGNSGIGLATAKAFVAEGAKVVISGRDRKALDAAVPKIGGEVMAVQADISKLSELERLFAETKSGFGGIDALFVNAGVARFAPLEETNEAFFVEQVAILACSDEGKAMMQIVVVVDSSGKVFRLRKPQIQFRRK